MRLRSSAPYSDERRDSRREGEQSKMNWEHKARVMRACARVPFGDRLYKALQKRFGRLSADPMLRLPTAAELTRWAMAAGRPVEGCTVLEVGTGHKAIVPVGLFLLGAKTIYTYDLHRRLDVPLMRAALQWIAQHPESIHELYGELTAHGALDKRLALLTRYADVPLEFFAKGGITYHAPGDAAHTPLPDGSVDLHVSVTVLEHVPGPVIEEIFVEARRLLSPSGIAVHIIDPSDHFARQDASISAVNFLQFSEEDWSRIAGNEFAYCNRLRQSELLPLFVRAGFSVERAEREVDAASVTALRGGFPLHADYRDFDTEDLCTTTVRVLLR